MPRGKWDTLPCRYSDLATDPKLRRSVRWGLERVRADLVSVGGRDTLAMHLARDAVRLLASIPEPPLFPARRELEPSLGRRDHLLDVAITRGLQALGWLVDERGLGGGQELDGLAWTLKLDRLWELYVAAHVSGFGLHTGGQLYLGDIDRRGPDRLPASERPRPSVSRPPDARPRPSPDTAGMLSNLKREEVSTPTRGLIAAPGQENLWT